MKRRLVLFFAAAAAFGVGLRAEDPPKDVPPVKAEGPLLDAAALKRLGQALDCVNLSVEDLGWDKRPIKDDWRLNCVNDTLDHPLKLADYAQDAEKEFADSPEKSAVAAAKWLDLAKPGWPNHPPSDRPAFANVPVELDRLVDELRGLSDSEAVLGSALN
jgi:hypothetical protein